MGILSFFKGGADIAKPIDAVANGLDKLFTSDEERLTKAELLEKTRQQPELMLNELDKIYANSTDWFAKRARPFCVYVSGVNFSLLGATVMWTDRVESIPEWYIDSSMTAFLGALGIYGLARTVEKLGKK